MESFVDAKSHTSLNKVTLKEGETKVVALRKFDSGRPGSVQVNTEDWDIASCHQSFHLRDVSKKSYNDHYDMNEMYDDFIPVELKGFVFFQICGRYPGSTKLYSRYTNTAGDTDYADAIELEVQDNPKHLFLATKAGSSSVTFEKLWSNHPVVQHEGKVCDAHVAGPCMINFSTALERSGVDFKGMHGSVCGLKAQSHHHHFTNPYDFELWKKYSPSHYEWSSIGPLQKEPMPGLAAFDFMIGRQGIVLFWNYWDGHGVSAMFGGHIDLWNKDVMGNSLGYGRPTAGEAAFFRARKISFWPMDEHKRGRS